MPTKAIYATGTSLQLFLRPYGAGDSMGQLSQDCVAAATCPGLTSGAPEGSFLEADRGGGG